VVTAAAQHAREAIHANLTHAHRKDEPVLYVAFVALDAALHAQPGEGEK
jgi:hypothetical protein